MMPTNKRRPEKDIITNFCRKRQKKISLKHGGEKYVSCCYLLALDGARGAFKELKKSSRKIIQWIEEAMEQKSEYPRRKSTFGAINFLFYELINNIEVYSVT